MNTTKFVIGFLACAFCCAVAQAESVAEKTEEVWDKTKAKTKQVTKTVAKKTKQAAKTVARETKETVNAIENKIDTPDADARKVTVTLSDGGGVQMPASLHPGKTAFVVTNNGKQRHSFEIEGQRVASGQWRAEIPPLAPKETKTMQVNLKPGSYEAQCKVAGHANKEAKIKLAVK